VNLRAIFKLPAAAATVVAIVALTVAACGGGGSGLANNGSCPHSSAHILGYGGGGGGGGNGTTNCPPPAGTSPTPASTPVGLLLTGENNVSVAPFGNVKGFFPGTNGSPPSGSNVVNLTAMQTVTFTNTEASGGQPHTASFIQSWGGSFPASPTIPSTASAAGTSISSSGFSSGNLNPGQSSAVYNAGTPGMFIFGCAYHYVSNGMRTVVIVH
jgi:hypothetical protein